MTLARGTKIGLYEVLAALGHGGMGEVYHARDPTLNRDVALKVLPESFAGDPERLARFRREARVLASLNHPNIAAIYGVTEGGATKALVLELVEGPTLAERIARGRLPLDETLGIASEIALALEAAHELGVVHRDLKPANIKLTARGASGVGATLDRTLASQTRHAEGAASPVPPAEDRAVERRFPAAGAGDATIKILDFGLAKVLEPPGGAADLSQSPTITTPAMTQAGVLLGTAAYMSPEQARGRAADRRTDIWAFGCVVYEMLAGRPAFDGEDMAEVLGAVVRLEPTWSALPATVPPAVLAVLKRCLQKDPALRMRDIADARFAIDDGLAAQGGTIHPTVPARTRAGYTSLAAAALVALIAGMGIAWSVRRTSAERPETRLEIVTPPTDDPLSLAMAPDGRSLVFQARDRGQSRLWLRRFETEEAQPLRGTERGTLPFFSPDGGSIAFFADGSLKRIDLAGGFVRTLASAPQGRRGSWNREGTIIFGATSVGPLYRVPADGGAVEQATTLVAGQTNHRWPQFLPDGRRFLLFALGSPDVRGVYLGSLAEQGLRRISDRESAYLFLPPAHVLFARQGALWVRRLSPEYTSVEGDLIPVAPRVLVHSTVTGLGAFSSSSAASIVYRASAGSRQLVWLDRTGRPVATLGEPDDAQLQLGHVSSDGDTAAVTRIVNGNTDVWLVDTERGVTRRLTSDPAIDGTAIFSPDGARVMYLSDGRADVWDTLYERASGGTGDIITVFEFDDKVNKNLDDWSPDGQYVLYSNQTLETDYDLWALPLAGERRPFEVARTPYSEVAGRFSPDGRWVAFQSTETGRAEIYLQPFPEAGPKLQVSAGGGAVPRWRRDGSELFYLAPDNRVMAVSLGVRGSRIDAAPPRGLFTLPNALTYESSADGQRFLVAAPVSDPSPITVILNWKPPTR